ncbi:MAG: histidinol dehydrogenase [Actinobacteria bacterium]|nr:histidinol dehydrogenase [Actinomycetota bacterium]
MKVIKEGGHRLFEEDPETTKYISELLTELERDRMDAVRKYSIKFDSWDPKSFELSCSEIDEAVSKCSAQLISDTEYCQSNVREFAQAQLSSLKPLEKELRPGIILGHKHIPVDCVGSYIPGGAYPMFGSAQMSIIPAKIAGVKTVVACTPPVKNEGYYPATINAMKKAGADRIFVLGGVQALAMMAFGMEVVPPADVICGAGNKFIAEAKRQLYGRCGIDILAGPTEIAIIADDDADPVLVAADILGQAEHDPNSGQLLICLSEGFALKTLDELNRQLEFLPTREIAKISWGNNGKIYVAESRQEALSLSDYYAPEHLELHVKDIDFYFNRLKNYGSLFIGEETTVAYGDKSIGTNHILPTSRAARYTGGVWVGKFLKTVTYQKMTREASIEIGRVTERQCIAEHMLAHGITARMRVDKYSRS